MTHIRRSITFLFPFLLCIPYAAAQSVDVHLGLGTARDTSSGQSIDTFGDGNLYSTPAMSGLFLNTGAGIMVTPHFGFGGEISFRPGKDAYAGLNYRPLFYDFNGIYQPSIGSKRVVPELQAGLGGVNLRFYYNQQACDAFAGCASANSYVESSNHFQLHFGAGMRFYVTPHVFVRPQFDLHWVNNFFQFGRNLVPQYGVAVGYSFGSDR